VEFGLRHEDIEASAGTRQLAFGGPPLKDLGPLLPDLAQCSQFVIRPEKCFDHLLLLMLLGVIKGTSTG
jgi:hypothetical protein